MSYKKDLENAKTFEDYQKAYDKECKKRLTRYEKKYPDDYYTRMIANDYSVWTKAQERLLELYPELVNSFDPDDRIQSRF